MAQFGTGVDLLTPKPTSDLDEIKASVRAVRDDPDGKGRRMSFSRSSIWRKSFAIIGWPRRDGT